jgi:hypothetical protein
MDIKELLEKENKLTLELNDIVSKINAYKDGYKYIVCFHSYGNHWKETFTNYNSAKKATDEYYQDNGYAHLFTNNPNVSAYLQSGNVYFIEDIIRVSCYSHPEEAISMSEYQDTLNS